MQEPIAGLSVFFTGCKGAALQTSQFVTMVLWEPAGVIATAERRGYNNSCAKNGSHAARSAPFDSPFVLSLLKGERFAQDRLRTNGSCVTEQYCAQAESFFFLTSCQVGIR